MFRRRLICCSSTWPTAFGGHCVWCLLPLLDPSRGGHAPLVLHLWLFLLLFSYIAVRTSRSNYDASIRWSVLNTTQIPGVIHPLLMRTRVNLQSIWMAVIVAMLSIADDCFGSQTYASYTYLNWRNFFDISIEKLINVLVSISRTFFYITVFFHFIYVI